MSSMRLVAELGGDWGGCARDSFDLGTDKASARLSQRKVARKSEKLLARTIEAEIIPKLVIAHKSSRALALPEGSASLRPSSDDVADFAELLLSRDVTIASAYVEAMCARGATLEIVFLDLFTGAARLLGRMWDEDLCDFTDVTIALSRLQQLLRELAGAFEIGAELAPCCRSALLVAAPGDQHTFGVFILQEFFRRAGWDVQGGSVCSSDELLAQVERGRFDVVGLSVSNEIAVGEFAAMIRTVRKVAPPRALHIMVGGGFFLQHPDCVMGVGADATAQDGRRAVLRVSSLLGTNALR